MIPFRNILIDSITQTDNSIKMNPKIIRVTGYGLFLLSIDSFQDFLKEKKIKSKKINSFFDKNNEIFKESLKEGAWLPIARINSIKYEIKGTGHSEKFSDEWEEVLSVESFNLKIGKSSSFWVLLIIWMTGILKN